MTIPSWLTILSWVSLDLAGIAALWIVVDIARGRGQPMAVMNVVWPVTALYFGPLAPVFYFRFGRATRGAPPGNRPPRPYWEKVFVSATHCGAGCTLGDVIADFAILGLGISLVASAVATSFILDFCAAYVLGVLFQYLPMRAMGEGRLPALWKSIKADTASLIAFEIGLFGWMALVRLVWFPGLEADTALFWFMMQVGMVVGFITTYPANWWLIRAGIKHGM